MLLILESLPVIQLCGKQHLITLKFAAVARATVKAVAVALAQGELGGLAFWIAGLDKQHSLGGADGVPVAYPGGGLGHYLVMAAITALPNRLWQGAFIVGFFVVVIGLVDNILRHCWWARIPRCRTT